MEIAGSGELIGLGAYRNMPEGVLIYVEYIESAPSSNPTITQDRKYMGIGAALLAFGIQLSIDYGYCGAIYLKAKTTEIREHYIRNFGAIPFSRHDPFFAADRRRCCQRAIFTVFGGGLNDATGKIHKIWMI